MKYLALLFLLATCQLAHAQTMILASPNSVICDTEEQMEAHLLMLEASGKMPEVEGCGFVQRPVPAIMAPIRDLSFTRFTVTIVQIVFPLPLGVQYGYTNFRHTSNL
jgi:hypothetical protein